MWCFVKSPSESLPVLFFSIFISVVCQGPKVQTNDLGRVKKTPICSLIYVKFKKFISF